MKNLTLLFMAAFMTLMACAQGRPAVRYHEINGITVEAVGNSPRVALPRKALPKLMQGVVCCPLDAETMLEVEVWDDTPDYVLALLRVEYRNSKRAEEQYVVTYGHKSGVIDAVLALVDGDVTCLGAPFQFEGSEYRIWSRSGTVERTDTGFVVTRNYQTVIDLPNSFRQTEEGKWTLPYTVDNKGKMTMQKSLWYSMSITKPNSHLPDETERLARLESDECKTINTDFASFIKIYCSPLSAGNEPQTLEDAYAVANAVLSMPANETKKATFRNLKNHTALWLQRLMYRNPQQWLEWLYANRGKAHCSTALSDNLNRDADFAAWLKTEVKKLKDKKMRTWWDNCLK